MLTYDGIRTTPGERYEPYRATAGGTTRTPSCRVPGLERDLVLVLERTDLAGFHLPGTEVVENRLLHLGVHDPVVPDRLGDAHLAAVERSDRLLGGQSTFSRIRAARSQSL